VIPRTNTDWDEEEYEEEQDEGDIPSPRAIGHRRMNPSFMR